MAEFNTRFILPLVVGCGIVAVVMVIALTDLADPLINYIHTNTITPAGAILCIIFSGVGFFAVYKLLAKLGTTFLENDEEK